jgi:hypothetical protein
MAKTRDSAPQGEKLKLLSYFLISVTISGAGGWVCDTVTHTKFQLGGRVCDP